MINFSSKYCYTIEKLLESNGFRRVFYLTTTRLKVEIQMCISFYVKVLKKTDSHGITDELVDLFRLLTVLKTSQIVRFITRYENRNSANLIIMGDSGADKSESLRSL